MIKLICISYWEHFGQWVWSNIISTFFPDVLNVFCSKATIFWTFSMDRWY